MQLVPQPSQATSQSRVTNRGQPVHGAGLERISLAVSATFVFLSIILFCNLNGIVVMVWEIPRAFSIFILAFCLLSIALLGRYIGPSLRAGGGWFFAFYLWHIAVGGILALESPFVSVDIIADRALRYLASVLVIVTYSAFGYLVFRAGKQGLKLMRVLFIICCVSSLSALLSVVYPTWMDITGATRFLAIGRYTGFFANPNETGLQGALTIAVGAFVALRTGKVSYFSAGVICGGAAGLLSFSRTGILLSMATALAAGLLIQRRGISVKGVFALVVGAGLAVMFISVMRGVAKGSESRFSFTGEQTRRLEQTYGVLFEGRIDEKTTSHRTELARDSIEMWAQSPLVGNGLTALDTLPTLGGGPHNTFLQVLGETGLCGFFLFAAALVSVAIRAWRLRSASVQTFVVASLIVLCGACMVSHNVLELRNHNALMGLTFGMAAAAPVRAPRRRLVPRNMPIQPAPSYRPVHGAVR